MMRDIAGSYTWPFTMAGLLLLPAALSSLSIREQTYATKMQPRPASAIAFDRSPEGEVIDIQASSP